MTAGAAVYSPGYQLPLWLGSGQLRLWRRLDRLLGSHSSGRATVRGLAADTGANPGAVSRDLGRLAALGFVVRSTRRGRLGGVELWRVVQRRRRELAGHLRALRRMRVPGSDPGSLQLALATVDGRAWWDTEPDPEPEAGDPASGKSAGSPEGGRRSSRSPGPGPDPELPELAGEPTYVSVRCGCGRWRVARAGETLPPCPHVRAERDPAIVTEAELRLMDGNR